MNENPHRRSGIVMLVLAWLLLFGGAYWLVAAWQERDRNPNTHAVLAAQRGEVVLERNRAGHYVADGAINGVPVRFLLDTGATEVAVPKSLARELGLRVGGVVTVQTANGPVAGFQTRLESVRLGAIELSDVAALVTEGLDSETVLLGMSFLNRLDFSQRAGRLTLHPARG